MRSRSILALVAAFAIVMSVSTRSAKAAVFNSLTALEQSDEFALDPMFDSTGWFTVSNAEGRFFGGSGVLIDPYWVLTAGHVILEEGTTQWTGMEFSVAPSAYDGIDTLIAADAMFVFEGYYDEIPPGGGDDIGLVRLSQPIYDVDPAVRYYGEDPLNPHFYAAGYGSPGVWPDMPGNDEFDGIKRAGENIADYHVPGVDANRYWESDLSSDGLPLEWNLSKYDSGGGWYSDIDGQMQLIGVSNFIRGLSGASGGIRVSVYNSWIDDTMAANPVPEPSSLIIFVTGMLGWLGLSLRRGLA
jgi:hypothetical protein